jgi:predicted O-methyltransferase YrrM
MRKKRRIGNSTMPILPQLFRFYREHDCLPLVGLSPTKFGSFPLAVYTWMIKDGKNFTQGLGISMQEVYFLECLFATFHPTRVFAIGNSFGWSTIALSLLNPRAKVVAIDAGYDINSIHGIDLTNAISREHGLNCKALLGISPAEVSRVIEAEFDGPLDFVFIDGAHTNESVLADFRATYRHAGRGCIFAFHDVRDCNLVEAFETAKETQGITGYVLEGTASGIGVLFAPGAVDPVTTDTLHMFAPSNKDLEEIRQAASRYQDWSLGWQSRLK